jgi:phospholipase C
MKYPVMFGTLTAAFTVGMVSALAEDHFPTATPIKHLVVIFQENVSFDHYFGTYPNARKISLARNPSTPRRTRRPASIISSRHSTQRTASYR